MPTPPVHTGAMIALMVPEPEQYALYPPTEASVPADELHITLAYLGESEEISAEEREQILDAVQILVDTSDAATALFPAATGVFPPDPEADTSEDFTVPYYTQPLPVEPFANLREQLLIHLGSRGVGHFVSTKHPVFHPHVTITYDTLDTPPDLSYLPTPMPVSFSTVIVKFGDEIHEFQLGTPETVGPPLPLTASVQYELKKLSHRTHQSEDYLLSLYLKQRGVTAKPTQTRTQAALERTAFLADQNYTYKYHSRIYKLLERAQMEPDPALASYARVRALALASRTITNSVQEQRELEALTASLRAMTADGNSSIARSLRAKRQLRDRSGRWIEMGGGVRFKIAKPGTPGGGTWNYGIARGVDTANGTVKVELEDGRMVSVPASKLDQPKAIRGLKGVVEKVRGFLPKSLGRPGAASPEGREEKDARRADADALDVAALEAMERLQTQVQPDASGPVTGGHISALADQVAVRRDTEVARGDGKTEAQVVGRVAPFKERPVTVNLDDIEAVQKAIDSRVSSNLPENFKSMTEEDRRRARSSAAGKAIASLGGLYNDRNDEKAKELRRAPGIKDADLEEVTARFEDDQGIPSHEELAAAADQAFEELSSRISGSSPYDKQIAQLGVHIERANSRLLSGDDELPEYLDNLDLLKEFANSQEDSEAGPPGEEEIAFSAFAEDLDDIHKSAEGTDDVSAVRSVLEELSGQVGEDGEDQIKRISGGLDRGEYLSNTTALSKDLKSLQETSKNNGATDEQLTNLEAAIGRISSDESEPADATPSPEAPVQAPEPEVEESEPAPDGNVSTNTLLAEAVRAAMDIANGSDTSDDEKSAANDAWTRTQQAKIDGEAAGSVSELDPAQIPAIDASIDALDELDAAISPENQRGKDAIAGAKAGLEARRERLSRESSTEPPSTDPDDYSDAREGSSDEEAAVVAAREDALGAMVDMISDPENEGEYLRPESDEGQDSLEAYNEEIYNIDPWADDPELFRDSAQVLEESGTGVVDAFSGDERVGPDKVDAFSKANEGLVDSLNKNADSKSAEVPAEAEIPADSEENSPFNQLLDHADALAEYAALTEPVSPEREALDNAYKAVANIATRLERGDLSNAEAADLLTDEINKLDPLGFDNYDFADDLAGTISDIDILQTDLRDTPETDAPEADVPEVEAPEAATPTDFMDAIANARADLLAMSNEIQIPEIRDRIGDVARALGAIKDGVDNGDMSPEEAADFVERASRNIDRILNDPRADRVLDANDGERRSSLESIRDSLAAPAPESAPEPAADREIEDAPDVDGEQLVQIMAARDEITRTLEDIDNYINAEPDFEAGQGRDFVAPPQNLLDSFDNSRDEINNAFEEFDADQITADKLQERVRNAIDGWYATPEYDDVMQANRENVGPDFEDAFDSLKEAIGGEDVTPEEDSGEELFDPWASLAVSGWVDSSVAVEDLPGVDVPAFEHLVDRVGKLSDVKFGEPYEKPSPKPRRSRSGKEASFNVPFQFGAQHGKQGVLNVAPPGSKIVAVEDRDRVFNGNMSADYLVRHPDGTLHVYHDQHSVIAPDGDGITSRPMGPNDAARMWHSPAGTPFDGFDEVRDASDAARRYKDKLENQRDTSSNENEVAVAEGELDRVQPLIEALEAEEEVAVDPNEPEEFDADSVERLIQQLSESEHPLAGILAAGLSQNHKNGVPITEADLQAIRDTVGIMAASPDADPQDKAELNQIADALDVDVLPDPDPSVDLPIDDLDDPEEVQSDYDAELPVSKGQDRDWDDKAGAPDPEGVDEAVKEQSIEHIKKTAKPEDADALDDYEPKTPTQLPEESHPLNIQQQVIADDVVADRKSVKVVAKAGTGKTSTLEAIARRFALLHPGVRIRYVAFNKDVQLEADQRMPDNTESRTGHSLAWSFVGPRINKKFKDNDLARSNRDMARAMGVTAPVDGVSASRQAKLAKHVVDRYSLSADDKINDNHFFDAEGKDLSEGLTPGAKGAILSIADRMWEDIKLPAGDGKLAITQDHMRKMWALSKPDFGAEGFEVLFLDEAQDTPPVLAKVIADQTIQKVIVGDPDQAIYGFTGATNYLEEVELDEVRPLTTSYRFGKNIQDIANRFLQALGSKDRVIGGGPDDKLVDDIPDPDAVLVRTNAGAIAEIIRELEAGRTVGVPKGTKANMLSLVNTANWLQSGANPRSRPHNLHEDLAEFDSWKDLLQAAQSGDNPVASMVKRLLENYDYEDLKNTIKSVHDPADASVELERTDSSLKIGKGSFDLNENLKRLDPRPGRFGGKGLGRFGFRFDREEKVWVFNGDTDAQNRAWARVVDELGGIDPNGNVDVDVTVSTAHKSKGLEWKKVRIGDDFKGPKIDEDTGEIIAMPDPEELRLAYVAVTRAETALSPGSLSWIFDHTSENGGENDETPEPSAVPEVTPEESPSPEPRIPLEIPDEDESGGEADVAPPADSPRIPFEFPQETDPREALPIEAMPESDIADSREDDRDDFEFNPDVAIENVNRMTDVDDLRGYRDRILPQVADFNGVPDEDRQRVVDAINKRIEFLIVDGNDPLAAWERELLGLPVDVVDGDDAGDGTPNTPYAPPAADEGPETPESPEAPSAPAARAPRERAPVVDGNHHPLTDFQKQNLDNIVTEIRAENPAIADALQRAVDMHVVGDGNDHDLIQALGDAIDGLGGRARGGDHDPLMNRLQGAQAAIQRNMRRNWPDRFEMHLLRDVVGRIPDPIDDNEAADRAEWVANMHVGGENKRFPILAPVEQARLDMVDAAVALMAGDREGAKADLARAIEGYKAGIQLRANADRDDAFKRRLEDRLRESEWLLASLEQRVPNLILGGRQVRGGGRFLPGVLPDRNGEMVHDGDIVTRVGRGVEGQEAIVIGVRGDPNDPDNEPYFSIRLISRDENGEIVRNPDGSIAFDRRFLTAAINRVELQEARNPNRDVPAVPAPRPAPAAPAAPAAEDRLGRPIPAPDAGEDAEHNAYQEVVAALDSWAGDNFGRMSRVNALNRIYTEGSAQNFIDRVANTIGEDNPAVKKFRDIINGNAPDAEAGGPATDGVQVVDDMLLGDDQEGRFGLVGDPVGTDEPEIADYSGVSDPRSVNELPPNLAPGDPNANPSMWSKWKGRAGAIASARRMRPDASALLQPGLAGADLKQMIASIYGADVRRPRLDADGNPMVDENGKKIYDYLTFGKKDMRISVGNTRKTATAGGGVSILTTFTMHSKDGQPLGTITRKLKVSPTGRITAENEWLKIDHPDVRERSADIESLTAAADAIRPENPEHTARLRAAQTEFKKLARSTESEPFKAVSRTGNAKKLRDIADGLEQTGLNGPGAEQFIEKIRKTAQKLADTDHKETGFSSAFNRYMEDWYIANNRGRLPAQVGIHAALQNGAYVWAKNGFRFKGSAANQITAARGFLRQMESNATSALEKAHIAHIKSRLDAGVPVLPFELAHVGWQNGMSDKNGDTWLGKKTLNGTGAHWHGAKSLSPTAREQVVSAAYQDRRPLRQRAEAGEFAAPVAPSFNLDQLKSRLANSGMSMVQVEQIGDTLKEGRSLYGLTPSTRRKLHKVVSKMAADQMEFHGAGDPDPETLDGYRSLLSIQRALTAAYRAEHPAQTDLGVGNVLAKHSWDDLRNNRVRDFRVTSGNMGGINGSIAVTHTPSGQIFYVKKNSYSPGQVPAEYGANAEVDIAHLLGMNPNFPGLGVTQISSDDNKMIISTKVGDAVGLVDRPKNAMDFPNLTDDLGGRKPLANPSQVLDMLVLDAVTHNIDRHNGNYQAQKDPDGNWYLFPIDHGLAGQGRRWGEQDHGQDAADFLITRLLSQRLYGNTLTALVRRLGSAGAKAELMKSIKNWRGLYESGQYRDSDFIEKFGMGLDELEAEIDRIIKQLLKKSGRSVTNMRGPIDLPDWDN